ncbi:hypothetical protein pmac_cds_321 [Pandoravirus macleodensis]|uniref:Uncharacterized protein n=1 Tax=Pandoravirus macleodensis TaxID=2107707 RepID=A0A2U7UEW4_9VIRU|nr:hypothetical protein pmac_cds_321 [Pandoravirus macleodensis]AVK77009.1 hypothetical protein pmac_cds_321 [Pandoravirus macleodensis]
MTTDLRATTVSAADTDQQRHRQPSTDKSPLPLASVGEHQRAPVIDFRHATAERLRAHRQSGAWIRMANGRKVPYPLSGTFLGSP